MSGGAGKRPRCGAENPYTLDGVRLVCGRELGHTGVHVDFDTYSNLSVGFGKERATAEENARDSAARGAARG